jgi:hypothetical protein
MKHTTAEILEYLRANPMGTVAEAQRGLTWRKLHAPCAKCNGEGFAGLPEKLQRLGRMLGRTKCPVCGRGGGQLLTIRERLEL